MSKLNRRFRPCPVVRQEWDAPRTIPREFKVFSDGEVVWLYDDSERTLLGERKILCIYAEAIYSYVGSAYNDDEYDILPDPSYFDVSIVASYESVLVPVDDEVLAVEYDEREAWDDAREEANANRLL